MHRAPAVNFTVKRSRWQARLIVCLGLAAVVTSAVFLWDQAAAVDARIGILAFSTVLAGGTAFLGWRRSPQGSLHWDGEHWYWSGFADKIACRLEVLMDLQSVFVVTATAESRAPVFLWLEAMPGDTNWKPLRRALVSSQAVSGGKTQKAQPAVERDHA